MRLKISSRSGDVRVQVPPSAYLFKILQTAFQLAVFAMSAATLLACACDKIIMAKHSAVGPIDPQIGCIAAHAILKEFEKARQAVPENPKASPIWLDGIKNLPFEIPAMCVGGGERLVNFR